MKQFYVIATPIGNLEDITLRAIRILKEVDLVLCEDTRVTKKLLDKYEIKTPTMSYHSQSKLAKIDKILDLIDEGKILALVSDAGTPCISDPGSLLVSKIKEKFLEDIQIIPIPGPSAVISALSGAGVPASDFLFLGFLPHKKGRETLFKEISESKRTVAFYESPHRILKTLESLKQHLGNERKIILARELTKIYEQIISGTGEELLKYFEQNLDKIKGEFVVIVPEK
ncbi:MAG: Ribosomal RNA small subunit methyltransferase I [Parcubacteria group bacterium Athens0714_16]|nr:MAG: Ribosomal RNA small subunit methyltransferase I [Parcubacteria group bacterium Athens0714_16]